jgi:hypothetical protein
MRRSVAFVSALAGVVAVLLAPVTAHAAQRWATAQSTTDSGACPATSPCRIDYAVHGASAGDEVVVTPGTYDVTTPLKPTVPIDLHGVAGQPRPRLIGSSGTALLTFKAGGSLRHLALEGIGAKQDALTIRGGLAEDLLLVSSTGDGAKVDGAAGGTILRDSVVQSSAATEGAAGLKLRNSAGPGDATVLNVTVMATAGSAEGIRCELSAGQATIVNVVVRGAVKDINASTIGATCTAQSSNFRPALSPGVTAGPGNQQGSPRFADAANGDYRPLADSPTVDAGSSHALLGSSDPAGCPRVLGPAPDIGAYEYANPGLVPCAWAPPEAALSDPVATGDPEIDEAIRGVPPPVLGRTVVVAPGSGKVRVRRPASPRFRLLDTPKRVPVGSMVDVREGRVTLVSAVDGDGELQAGTFWGSQFQVRQRRRRGGMTRLVLRGGNFAGCGAAPAGTRAAASRRRRIRGLWGRDRHGRFSTHGQNSVATTRGTSWFTEDRCDGTLTRVSQGSVTVRDLVNDRTVIVRAGHSYLAPNHK